MPKPSVKDFSAEDALSRQPAWDGWLAPTLVEIEQGSLGCPVDQLWEGIAPDRQMFAAFVRLADAPDKAIRDFALKWGMLILCSAHALPVPHLRASSALALDAEGCPALREGESVYWTRLEDWRRYARTAGAVVRLSESLRYGESGSVADWEIVRTAHGLTLGGAITVALSLRDAEERIGAQRRIVADVVDLWLRLGGVEPHLQWIELTPAIKLGSGQYGEAGFFGAIAVQLMLAVSDTGELVTCSVCGRPYVPTRKPNPNRERYCPDCGRKAALARAAAKYREKQRGSG